MNNENQVALRQSIVQYLHEQIMELSKTYPTMINADQEKDLIEKYLSSGNSLDEVKQNFEVEKQDRISKYMEMVHENKIDAHVFATNRAVESITNSDKLYLCGGTTAYFLLNQQSEHPTVHLDAVCDMKNIDDLRKYYQNTPYYRSNWDSKNQVKDGNDYGFQLDINGITVNINPYTYDNGKLTQYSWEYSNQYCDITETHINSIEDYVTTYVSKTGKPYQAMTMEAIAKQNQLDNKLSAEEQEKIVAYGVREEVYNNISKFDNIQSKTANELNSTVTKEDAIKNRVARNRYVMKELYGKEMTDEECHALENEYQEAGLS